MKNAKRRVIFLDRDGTLIYDRPGCYLRRPEQLRLYRDTVPALRLLKRAGFRLVVISNQSGVGRGYLDLPTLERIHRLLRRELRRRGAGLDGIYFCPHHPDRRCRCRKPSPLLARRAARELGLSLAGAAVVGDKKADIDLARALGVDSVFLRTGHGRAQRARYGARIRATRRSSGILAAAKWLIGRSGP